jgi:hypothetical protein
MLHEILSLYLESFPHHKHLSNAVISSEEPSAITAIEEAKRLTE